MGLYGQTDYRLWDALTKYPITGKRVVNIGSVTPWYEATCLRFGGTPTTIEYNRIITRTDRIRIMTPNEYEAAPVTFDAGLSISSLSMTGSGSMATFSTPTAT